MVQGWGRESIQFSHETYVHHCSPQRKNAERERERDEDEGIEKKKTTRTRRLENLPLPSGDTVSLPLPVFI